MLRLLLLSTALLGACGVTPSVIRELPMATRGWLTPDRSYRAPESRGEVAKPAALRPLADAVRSALEPAARAQVVHDPALDFVAGILAKGYADEDRDLSTPLVHWAIRRIGASSFNARWRTTWFHFSPGKVAGRSVEDFRESAIARVANAILGGQPGSFGAAEVWTGPRYAFGVVYLPRLVSFQSVPKQIAPGATLTLQGKLLIFCNQPRALFEDEKGNIVVKAIEPGPDGSFQLDLSVPQSGGTYWLNLIADPTNPAHRARTLLALPFYVGIDEPDLPPPSIRNPPPDPQTDEERRAAVVSELNRARERAGLKPLSVSSIASQAAASRLTEKGKAPLDSQICKTLRERGMACADVLSTEWFASSLAEGFWLLHSALYFRSWLLDAAVTEIGLAVARRERSVRVITYLVRSEGQ